MHRRVRLSEIWRQQQPCLETQSLEDLFRVVLSTRNKGNRRTIFRVRIREEEILVSIVN